MLIAGTGRRSVHNRTLVSGGLRARLTRLLKFSGNTVANYQLGVGLTGVANASAWANQIGAAGPLLQATGSAQPAIQPDKSLLFDGVAMFMAAAFTLIQPETIYFVGNQIAFSTSALFDGNTALTMTLIQDKTGGGGVSPNIVTYAGSYGPNDLTHMTLGAYHVITAVFNGASSSLTVDSNTTNTGDVGASNGSGLVIASRGALGVAFANMQLKEVIVRSSADSAAMQANVQALLKAIHGTP